MINDKGLSIFMTKNAEAEPWLIPHAFVPPTEFEFFKGLNSSVIYARSGTGKTTINLALAEFARTQLKCLPVSWTPDISIGVQPPSTELAMAQFAKILSACAHELLHAFAQDFKKRKQDNQEFDFVIEFIDQFIPAEDRELFKKVVPATKSHLIHRDTKLDVIATELIKSLKYLDYPGGIWIMIDGLGWNSDAQKQIVVNAMRSILSTLSLFEISNLHFKMILPMELERDLVETPTKVRERVSAFRISWESKHLQIMIEKRLRLALNNDKIQSSHIYPSNELFSWLEACGGLSPRGWLEYFRPIFATIWENFNLDGIRQLTKQEWDAARKRSSLQLRYYPELRQIAIGMNAPRTLSPEEFAIFSYLYEHQGDYCSKRDIYNKAYLPFNSKGQGRELGPNDELTKEFDDLVNTTIYRLRKTIEPLPKSPVFLTMKKNLGYRLSLQAFLD
jgi:hypothetical protein